MAMKYRRYGVPVVDLIGEGNYGIVCALQRFEPERGHRFVTYAAYWIRAHILQYVIRSWSIVSGQGGALRSKMFFRLRRERARIYSLLGESEQAQLELSNRLNLPVERLEEYQQRLVTRDVSLESEVFEEGGTRLVDTLTTHEQDQEDDYSAKQQQRWQAGALKRAIAKLDRRERFVLESTILCDDAEALSLAEVGRRLGVSRERTRQLSQRALRKVREQLKRSMGTCDCWSLSA
jgi:RNA polymerase sigma-32 factor